MNYLAHLYLADDSAEARLGNLMGDFVKGPIDGGLSPAWAAGIRLHRRIDSFTDRHPLVVQSKRRVRPEFRRYGGILVDLYYDHFLANGWEDYADVSLDAFADTVYAEINHHAQYLPATMQRSMHYLVTYDLLRSYRQLDGLGNALRGIATRLKRPVPLGDAIIDLEANYEALQDDFRGFFPELVRFTHAENTNREVRA